MESRSVELVEVRLPKNPGPKHPACYIAVRCGPVTVFDLPVWRNDDGTHSVGAGFRSYENAAGETRRFKFGELTAAAFDEIESLVRKRLSNV